MAQKTVVWTETAVRQRREILRYWTIRNKSTAYSEKLILLIRERIRMISENPESGKATTFESTREAALGNFSIYYKILPDTIVVTAFWDNRQDPGKLLEIIFKKS